VIWDYGSIKLRAPGGWKVQVLKGDHQILGGVTHATYCTTVATREGESIVQQGLPVGIPADLSQVVDRMTSGEPCADPTKGSSSWPTLGADCRTRVINCRAYWCEQVGSKEN
jgi:hypothetical protein